MINTLLGVGIGYLIFKWADSNPINTPSSPSDGQDDPTPTPPNEVAVWTLTGVSNIRENKRTGVFYGCGTYRRSDMNLAGYSVVVDETVNEKPLSDWSKLQGPDGEAAYSYASKTDCVKMVNYLVRERDAPETVPEEEEPTPAPTPPKEVPEFGNLGGYGTGGYF